MRSELQKCMQLIDKWEVTRPTRNMPAECVEQAVDLCDHLAVELRHALDRYMLALGPENDSEGNTRN